MHTITIVRLLQQCPEIQNISGERDSLKILEMTHPLTFYHSINKNKIFLGLEKVN